MTKVLVTESSLEGIAAAIRTNNGTANTYKPGQMAAAIEAIPTGITPSGTINITENGTVDVTNYASANVNVPNSYAAGDEGKVVSNGALVAQSARASEITANGTYDTTTNNSVTVSVSGGGSGGVLSLDTEYGASGAHSLSKSITITEAGTYRIVCGGVVGTISLKINNTTQSKDYYESRWYANLYDKTVSLSAGDTVDFSSSDTGSCYMFFTIVKL